MLVDEADVHVGDVGTVFRLEVRDQDDAIVDVSGATTMNITFKKPSGTTAVKTAVHATDGTDGLIQYITVSGDIDEAGVWQYQGFIDLPAWEGHTLPVAFPVRRNLA
jgi:hypothetical protein